MLSNVGFNEFPTVYIVGLVTLEALLTTLNGVVIISDVDILIEVFG